MQGVGDTEQYRRFAGWLRQYSPGLVAMLVAFTLAVAASYVLRLPHDSVFVPVGAVLLVSSALGMIPALRNRIPCTKPPDCWTMGAGMGVLIGGLVYGYTGQLDLGVVAAFATSAGFLLAIMAYAVRSGENSKWDSKAEARQRWKQQVRRRTVGERRA